MNNVLIITDNEFLYNSFCKIISEKRLKNYEFDFGCSAKILSEKYKEIQIIDIKRSNKSDFDKYGLIISLHCRQLFPKWLISKVRCVNIHPGLNPYNRGWYPQIFSIINGYPIGATIHEIDTELDNGNIIVQKEVEKFFWDNSKTLYERVLCAELELINDNIEIILNNSYKLTQPFKKGNVNLKKDFDDLLKFDLNKTMTGLEFLNYTRAMTHPGFNNLYFEDPDTRKKIFIQIKLEPEST